MVTYTGNISRITLQDMRASHGVHESLVYVEAREFSFYSIRLPKVV